MQSVYANSLSTFNYLQHQLSSKPTCIICYFKTSKSLLDCEELQGLKKIKKPNRMLCQPCIDIVQSLYTYQQTQVRDENNQQYHSTIVNMYSYTVITPIHDRHVLSSSSVMYGQPTTVRIHCMRVYENDPTKMNTNFPISSPSTNSATFATNPRTTISTRPSKSSSRKQPDTINSRVDALLDNVHASMSAWNQHMEVKRPFKMMHINSPPSIACATAANTWNK